MARTPSLLLGLAAGAALAAAAAGAAGELRCAPRPALLALAASAWGQRPAARGLLDEGGLLEILARPDGASFTLMVTGPGTSCLVQAGRGWQVLAPGRRT